MALKLTPTEARVLAVLLEKAITTPNYYPMSLAGITTGCNQKSNREPVMTLDESSILTALNTLTCKRLVWEKTPAGSRVSKYAHRLSNTLGLTYDFSFNELGVLCILMLRGPMTIGEVRTRGTRVCKFSSLEEAEGVLMGLCEHHHGPYVRKLARSAGHKEPRFTHLLCGDLDRRTEPDAFSNTVEPVHDLKSTRLTALENEVARLRHDLDQLRRKFDR